MAFPRTLLLLPLVAFGAHTVFASSHGESGPIQEPTAPGQNAATAPAASQSTAKKVKYAEVQEVVDALYQAVSFEKGGEPNWAMIENLCMEGAGFSQPPRAPAKRAVITTKEFIDSFKSDLDVYKMRETGFWERVVNTTTTQFGDTAVALVVFEVRVEKDGEKPMGRGLDTVSMVRSDGRWWVTSINTDWERPGQALPKELLQ
jgi:hypothetical protein